VAKTPHELPAVHAAQRVVESRTLLKALRVDAANGFVTILTTHESSHYWSCDHSLQWSTSTDLVPTRPLNETDWKKLVFNLMFSAYVLLGLGDVPKVGKMICQYFCDVGLEETRRAMMVITKK
jgi:hypothetical protein